MSEPLKFKVRILNRRDMVLYDEDGIPVPTREVAYSERLLGPGIVRIPIAKYTQELEDKTIREDLERRLSEKPEIREV